MGVIYMRVEARKLKNFEEILQNQVQKRSAAAEK